MKDKVIGACLGTAIGDALGMPAECKKPETIQRLYGKIKGYRTPKSARDGKPFHHNLK
jgi:ADP-ribosylglycohydrolase